MTYIMSCVWLDYMVKYFQCKNCVGSSPKTKKCVASFLVPGDTSEQALYRLLRFLKSECTHSASSFSAKSHACLICPAAGALRRFAAVTNFLRIPVHFRIFAGRSSAIR